MAVVTLARLIGARAHEVGELTAARLSAELVDRHLIDEVARRLQVPAAQIEELDEAPSSRFDRLLEQLASGSFEVTVASPLEGWDAPWAATPCCATPSR